MTISNEALLERFSRSDEGQALAATYRSEVLESRRALAARGDAAREAHAKAAPGLQAAVARARVKVEKAVEALAEARRVYVEAERAVSAASAREARETGLIESELRKTAPWPRIRGF